MSQLTSRLGLPLVQGAQAQKHVTVNEALARLDAHVGLVLETASRNEPPQTRVEGACYGVGANPVGDWAGQAGRIAIAQNGGWDFAKPFRGLSAFLADDGVCGVHDGNNWVAGAVTLGRFGSALVAQQAELEVEIAPGEVMETALVLPHGAMVIGVTARVVEPITGSLSSWRMGTEGATDRFGQGLGLQVGSWARGILSAPLTYWTPSPVLLSATDGAFSGGRVRVCAHWLELTLPA